jgi:lipopolysaccharide biosynthesis regulator YciM
MAKVIYTVRRRPDMRTLNTLIDQPISAAEDSDTYRLNTITRLVEEQIEASGNTFTTEDVYVTSEFIGDSDFSNKIWR